MKPGSEGSFVSGKHHLGEPDEGVSLCRWPEHTDLPDGFLTVALGKVVGLLHAIALNDKKKKGLSRCFSFHPSKGKFTDHLSYFQTPSKKSSVQMKSLILPPTGNTHSLDKVLIS